jgi:hypothetical protein
MYTSMRDPGSHICADEDSSRLRCYAVSIDLMIPDISKDP